MFFPWFRNPNFQSWIKIQVPVLNNKRYRAIHCMENYHIYDEVGRGKHSVMYKARRKQTIEYVAVKSTEKSRMKKVLNEGRSYL